MGSWVRAPAGSQFQSYRKIYYFSIFSQVSKLFIQWSPLNEAVLKNLFDKVEFRMVVSKQIFNYLAPRNTEYRIQNTEHRTQNTELRTRNTEHGTQNTEYRIQSTECRTQNTEPAPRNTEPAPRNSEPVTPELGTRTINYLPILFSNIPPFCCWGYRQLLEVCRNK